MSHEALEESKKDLNTVVNTVTVMPTLVPIFDPNRNSSWRKILRVSAWIMRWRRLCFAPTKVSPTFDADEVKLAEMYWVEVLQREPQVATVMRQSGLKVEGMKMLSPFIDSNGLLRVGGRLQHSNLSYDVKHPLILPSKHHLVKMLVVHYHQTSHHTKGVNAVGGNPGKVLDPKWQSCGEECNPILCSVP
jgi:hypothetical protein